VLFPISHDEVRWERTTRTGCASHAGSTVFHHERRNGSNHLVSYEGHTDDQDELLDDPTTGACSVHLDLRGSDWIRQHCCAKHPKSNDDKRCHAVGRLPRGLEVLPDELVNM